MVKNNANIDTKNIFDETPVMVAAYADAVECLKLLLEKGADIGATSSIHRYTAIHYAVMNGKVNSLKLLLSNTEHIEIRDQTGQTPLMMASLYEEIDCLLSLINLGANI